MGLAGSYVALSLLVLAVFSTFLWFAWAATIEAGRTSELQADAAHLRALAQRQGVNALAASIALQAEVQDHGHEYYLLLTDPAFRPLAGNLPVWPAELGIGPGRDTRWLSIHGRQVRMALVNTTLPGGQHLLVGNDVGRYRRLEFTFFAGLGAAVAAVLLLGLGGGMLLRRGLVAQINRLMGGVRQVSDAMAHDLRTPLSIVRARLERALADDADPHDTTLVIEAAIADIDQLGSICNALLRLAEIDSGSLRAGFSALELTEVVEEVAGLYQDLAQAQGQTLRVVMRGAIPMVGDPLLLAQAVANLLDNAVKYNRHGGDILINLNKDTRRGIRLTVRDQGEGIPDREKRRVLERFYRCDSSRATPGAGLGLCLVAAVAELHHGSLQFEDGAPGLVAVLWLPAMNK